MTELKKKINYTVACVSEFANKHEMTQQAAFQFLYEHKAIAFLKDCYEIEHTLSFDDAVEDMERICANNGGVLFTHSAQSSCCKRQVSFIQSAAYAGCFLFQSAGRKEM